MERKPPSRLVRVRVATVEEFRQSKLSTGREPQQGYDESSLKKSVNGKRFVVGRRDRFVFAACADRGQLEQACESVGALAEWQGPQ
jgi:ssDNA-binding replication factor A large subunit